jgi:hypothetical protein
MVHSNGTVVVLLHTQTFRFRLLAFNVIHALSTFCNFVNIITNCIYAPMTETNVTVYVNNSLLFFQVGLLRLISLHYQLSFPDFSL